MNFKKEKIRRGDAHCGQFAVSLILYVLLCLLVISGNTQAQERKSFPVVGEVLADHKFYDVVNHGKSAFNVSDSRGKWLLLDVWGYTCSACLASFPKMDKLYRTFSDRVDMVMVGATKPRASKTPTSLIEKYTKDIYKRMDSENRFSIPVAFDSVFFEKYAVNALPQIILIDPQGVVRAKVTNLDSVQIGEFLAGRVPATDRSFSYGEKMQSLDYNFDLPFLTAGREANGGVDTDFIFRSLISKATDRTIQRAVDLDRQDWPANMDYRKTGRFEVFNTDLSRLYRIAYFGKPHWDSYDSLAYNQWSPTIVWNTTDSALYVGRRPQRYTYSLSIPPSMATKETVMRMMRNTLKNCFGHTVSVERRNVPVYFLEVVDPKKAKRFISQTSVPKQKDRIRTGILISGKPFRDFSRMLAAKLYLDAPLIDNTQIGGNVEIDFKADFLNKKDVYRQLLANGLEIKKGKKEMKVIVVNDESDQNEKNVF